MAFTPWKAPFADKAIMEHYGTMSAFRKKNKMQPHSGTDYSPAGSNKGKTPIKAVANGRIKLIQWSNILGWVVVQSAADKDGKIWYIGYCHLACKKCGINCKGGHDAALALPHALNDAVKVGETVIANIGNSGTASSGAHLHATASRKVKGVFGVTADKVDLYKLIKKNSTAPAAPAAPAVTEGTN